MAINSDFQNIPVSRTHDWMDRVSWFTMRIRLVAQQRGEVPRFLGPVLHGAFGHALLASADTGPEARELIAIAHLDGANTDNNKTKQSYIFQVDLTAGGSVHPNYELQTNFIAHPIFTAQSLYMAILLNTFYEMAQAGLGPDQVPFNVADVKIDPAPLFRPRARGIEIVPSLYEGKTIFRRGPVPQRVQIVFRTPARLVSKGRILENVEGPVLFKRLWQRMSSWVGANDLESALPDFERIRVTEDRTHCWQASRWSSRQEKKIDISGLVGKIMIEGLNQPAWKLLQLGEHLHVGKGTTSGLGKYEIVNIVM